MNLFIFHIFLDHSQTELLVCLFSVFAEDCGTDTHAEVTQQICVPTDGRKNILGMQFYFENKELLLQWYLKMFCII